MRNTNIYSESKGNVGRRVSLVYQLWDEHSHNQIDITNLTLQLILNYTGEPPGDLLPRQDLGDCPTTLLSEDTGVGDCMHTIGDDLFPPPGSATSDAELFMEAM